MLKLLATLLILLVIFALLALLYTALVSGDAFAWTQAGYAALKP